jgi:hypothetical protein
MPDGTATMELGTANMPSRVSFEVSSINSTSPTSSSTYQIRRSIGGLSAGCGTALSLEFAASSFPSLFAELIVSVFSIVEGVTTSL